MHAQRSRISGSGNDVNTNERSAMIVDRLQACAGTIRIQDTGCASKTPSNEKEISHGRVS